jgi:hypothetical protein
VGNQHVYGQGDVGINKWPARFSTGQLNNFHSNPVYTVYVYSYSFIRHVYDDVDVALALPSPPPPPPSSSTQFLFSAEPQKLFFFFFREKRKCRELEKLRVNNFPYIHVFAIEDIVEPLRVLGGDLRFDQRLRYVSFFV